MATVFRKGDVVTVKEVTPSGPVQAIRMDEDGDVHYLISWVNAEGAPHSRWFAEEELVAA